MEHVPDDPRIRDAELDGYLTPDPVECPVCGDEADTFFLQDGLVIGCNHCVTEVDADPAFLD